MKGVCKLLVQWPTVLVNVLVSNLQLATASQVRSSSRLHKLRHYRVDTGEGKKTIQYTVVALCTKTKTMHGDGRKQASNRATNAKGAASDSHPKQVVRGLLDALSLRGQCRVCLLQSQDGLL